MRKVVADFWRSPATWSIIGLLFAALVCIMAAILIFQRHDYQRTSDASLDHAVEEIRSEVRSHHAAVEEIRSEVRALRAAAEKSAADRQRIKDEVRAVKEAVGR